MDNLENNHIDDYLLGRLEGKDLAAFEQKLQTDMDFAKIVSQQKQAMDLLLKVGDLEMKKEVQEVQVLFKKGKQPRSLIQVWRPWILAAAVIIMLIFSYFALQGPTAEQLFEANYTAYNISYGDRDASDPLKMKLAEASKYYQQKDFAQALPIFESVQSDLKDAKLQLMMGVTYLELNQFEKAQNSFSQIITEKDPTFQYHGLWYSALTYLKSGDIEKAKSQLQNLLSANNVNGVYKQTEAKIILEKVQ